MGLKKVEDLVSVSNFSASLVNLVILNTSITCLHSEKYYNSFLYIDEYCHFLRMLMKVKDVRELIEQTNILRFQM